MQLELLKILHVNTAQRSGCTLTAVLPQQLLSTAGGSTSVQVLTLPVLYSRHYNLCAKINPASLQTFKCKLSHPAPASESEASG